MQVLIFSSFILRSIFKSGGNYIKKGEVAVSIHILINQKLYNRLQIALMWTPVNIVRCCIDNHSLLPSKNQLIMSWIKHYSKHYAKIFEPSND